MQQRFDFLDFCGSLNGEQPYQLEWLLKRDQRYVEFPDADSCGVAVAYAVAQVVMNDKRKIVFYSPSFHEAKSLIRLCSLLIESVIQFRTEPFFPDSSRVTLSVGQSEIISCCDRNEHLLLNPRADIAMVLNPFGVGFETCQQIQRVMESFKDEWNRNEYSLVARDIFDMSNQMNSTTSGMAPCDGPMGTLPTYRLLHLMDRYLRDANSFNLAVDHEPLSAEAKAGRHEALLKLISTSITCLFKTSAGEK